MWKTLGVIDASDDSGLTEGCEIATLARRRIDGKPLLEWMARRVSDAQRLSSIVVVLPDSDSSREISQLIPPDVSVFLSAATDALSRLAAAAKYYDVTDIVRIRLNSPFADPVFIDRLVQTAEKYSECDYITYCHRDGRPALLSQIGLFAEWYRSEALAKASLMDTSSKEFGGLTSFAIGHPELFHMRLIPAPAELDRADVRLAVDSQEDWEHVEQIYDALGPDNLDWQGIADLLNQHPSLRERMARLNESEAGAT